MPNDTTSSAMGPVVFVGLSLFTLVTAGPVDPPPNPAERMDMDDIARVIIAHAPATGTPPEPVTTVTTLPRPTRSDLIAERAGDATFAAIAALPGRLPVFMPLPHGRFGAPSPGNGAPTMLPVNIAMPAVPVSPAPLVGAATTDATPGNTAPGATPAPATAAQALRLRNTVGTPPELPAALTTPFRPWLAPLGPPSGHGTAPEPAQNWFAVNAVAVHLRRAPNAISPFYTRLNPGDFVIASESRGNWTRVQVHGRDPALTGWMYTRYLDPADSPDHPAGENSSN